MMMMMMMMMKESCCCEVVELGTKTSIVSVVRMICHSIDDLHWETDKHAASLI